VQFQTVSNPLHRAVIDAILAVTVVFLVLLAIAGMAVDIPRPVFWVAVAGLALAAVVSVVARMVTRPDHLRARQSQHILEIADQSVAHLRRGLDYESADAVCRLALKDSEAAAVAITDREQVLGFAGIGEDHHLPGRPVMTRGTRDALDVDEYRILATRDEIGCPLDTCLLRAAILVPLEMRGSPRGTLKFYYTTPRLLNETQITMVQGLAKLLSTQLELSELDRQTELARDMELKALQSQVNPHFLFNTINTIAMLIRTDPTEARELLREFASFYRRTLENSEDLIPFGRELDYAHSYLRFEQARFGERLSVRERIPTETLDYEIPAFVVQPIVENSVKHGFRPDGALHVEISAERQDGGLIITVEDDGVGISPEDLPKVLEPGYGKGLGIALRNVDDRLKGHFGSESGLVVRSVEGEGTVVNLEICPPSGCESGVEDAAEGTGL
jgi:two-component system sensor histidine kinase LytS